MAKAIEQIEREILALEEAIEAIAKELRNAYTNYLTALGQTVQRQLILATYHLCTQGYPETFLSLSLNQRQQLQQAIRKLGQQTAQQLQDFIKTEQEQQKEAAEQHKEDEEIDEDEEDEETDKPSSPTPITLPTSPTSLTPLTTSPTPLTPSGPVTPSTLPPSSTLPPTLTSSTLFSLSSLQSVSSFPNTSNPVELVKWQQNIERVTQEKLKRVSREANLRLQKAGILPKKLPEPILEAAAAAASEASGEVMPGPPNLLNLVIEIDNEQESEDSNLTQIMAINLRLGEIEFADPTLSSYRKQIHTVLLNLRRRGQEYQKQQRERSIAQAEAAWRAIWSED
ncbi:primosomal protein [Brasilonema bromeliae]|uniref:Primosomal protein n=1 Tax=Brasilonema bromeliae SPC951 TaxID=385972 RepID=A0ABX1P9Z1_9CYAN|nr:primosomal protein [Brasilonema bromeliae]NMG20461.1 primosomal protein [Brasilonema bromeliae SPC951]